MISAEIFLAGKHVTVWSQATFSSRTITCKVLWSQKRQMSVGSKLKYCNLILQKICFLLCLEIYRVAIDSPATIRNGWRANSEWLEFITWAVMKHCFYIEKEKRRGLRKVFHSHFITNLITLWREVVLRVDCYGPNAPQWIYSYGWYLVWTHLYS